MLRGTGEPVRLYFLPDDGGLERNLQCNHRQCLRYCRLRKKCALTSALVPPEIRSRSVGIERGPMTSKAKGATVRSLVATLCTLVLLPGDTLAYISSPSQEATSSAPTQASKIPSDQLDSLVAPIALYPDPLLAQALAASTYPLEIIQLRQWLKKKQGLKVNAQE